MGRVVVFGSINMDCVVEVERHPKPGETLAGKTLSYIPGGKGANQTVAAARLGAPTVMFGQVGQDGSAGVLQDFLSEQGIDISNVKTADCATGTAFIAVDKNGENTIIIIPGANARTSYDQLSSFHFTDDDILVCQNEVDPEQMQLVFNKAKQEGAQIIYNPAPAIEVPSDLFALCDYLVINETEASFYRDKFAGYDKILIETLGAKGVRVTSGNENFTIEGLQVKVIDTTGAGDCFVGALGCALSQGQTLKKSVIFANKAASLSVQRKGAGTGMPFLKDLNA